MTICKQITEDICYSSDHLQANNDAGVTLMAV